MSNQVYANMMEVSCKSGSGKTICAFPDVCMTPPQTPATPPGVPIPYPNTGMASDTTDGSSTVKISGKEVMLKNKSCFKKSSGDEAGSAPKKGLLTSKNTGKVYFNAWSMDVKIEGENVVRHLDITTHNHASQPGNSPPMAHVDAMAPSGGADSSDSCPLDGACTGSPVNPVLGAKLLSGDEDLDFTVEGPLPLSWQRSYRSTSTRVGWFGQGWSSPLEVCLEVVPDATGRFVDRLHYVDCFGRHFDFPYLLPGESFFRPDEQFTLSRIPDGRYRLDTAQGLSYSFGERRAAIHSLVGITDRNGNAIHIQHAGVSVGNGVALVACSGKQSLELVFQDSRLLEIAELRATSGGIHRVRLASYRYSDRGDLVEVIDRAGTSMRRFEYNADRLMTHQVHAGRFEAWYEYNGAGAPSRVTRHWDNVGRSWTFEYLADRTLVTDQFGRVETYHFDVRRRWTGFTNAADQFTRRGVDRHGNIRAIVDPAGNVTETIFDELGNPIEMRDATGATTRIDWHPTLALPTAITDPLGRTTEYEYDARGNLVLEVDPTGTPTRYHYDERGLITVCRSYGGTTTLRYNDAGQVIQYTDCSGYATNFDYDANGWLIRVTNAVGEQTIYDYDAAGHPVRQTLPDGTTETYENDAVGRMTAVTSMLGAKTTFAYHPDGLVARRIDALGNSLTYQYDRARRLTDLVNENGSRYRFSYDLLDRLNEETRFDGTRIRYTYDDASYLIETVEAPNTPEAIVTRYRRDAVGRTLGRNTANTHRIFSYDAAGQVVQALSVDAGVKVERRYDKAGRLTEESLTAANRSQLLRHVYDAGGNRLHTILPDGTTVGTRYAGSGDAYQIRLNDQPIANLERDAVYREISRTQGKLRTSWVFDSGGRLERQLTRVVAGSSATAPLAPHDIRIDRQYRYDPVGRLSVTIDRGKSLAYGYDAVDHLTRFNEERFAFDPAHNLLPTADSPSGPVGLVQNNRLVVFEDKRYRYDAHGRVVERRVGAQTVTHFTWDDEHHLIETTTHDVRGANTTHYLYDAFGRRIAKRSDHGTTWFVWDDENLVQQTGDIAEHTFVYEPDSFVPLAQTARLRSAEDPDAQLYYYHCDQIGLPREMTDPEGNLAWEGEYKAWGRLSRQRTDSSELGHHPARVQPLRLQGQYFDVETGLHYNRFRYYDPDAGRFMTPDPMGLAGGFNQYAYAPNPVAWFDPLGLVPHPANCMSTTAPSHRYVIVEIATGKLFKTGISSKPLTLKGESGRANSQVNKLNKKAGSKKYKAVVAEKNISRCQAAQGEQDVVDKYYERNTAMPPGMKRPIPTVLKI